MRRVKRQIALGPQARQQSDKHDIGAAGRRVFGHAEERREHARLDIGATALVFDVKQNAGRDIGFDMAGKYVAARLRLGQRRACLELGEDERRAAGGDTGRVTGGLDIGGVKRTGVRDQVRRNSCAALQRLRRL